MPGKMVRKIAKGRVTIALTAGDVIQFGKWKYLITEIDATQKDPLLISAAWLGRRDRKQKTRGIEVRT